MSRSGLQGLSAPQPDAELQKSLAAIKKSLDLSPPEGYAKGSLARRRLEEAFESVPRSSAPGLFTQLKQGEGSLGKLFRYRLATPTREAMLDILKRKMNEFLRQQIEERRRLEAELQARLKELRDKVCPMLKEMDSKVEEICKLMGEDSDACQKARFEALGARVGLQDKTGVRCP